MGDSVSVWAGVSVWVFLVLCVFVRGSVELYVNVRSCQALYLHVGRRLRVRQLPNRSVC